MFIVYSPEGQNKVSSARQLPVQRLNAVHRVNQVAESGLSEFDLDSTLPQAKAKLNAAHTYQNNQKGERRPVAKAAQLMSNPVIVIAPQATLEYAWQLMQLESIKHLPVIEGGQIVGMCGHDDLLRRLYFSKDGLLKGDLEAKVDEVMRTTVVSTLADTDVRHIAQALTEYDIDVLVVMDAQQTIKGIITEKDLIHRLANDPPLEVYI